MRKVKSLGIEGTDYKEGEVVDLFTLEEVLQNVGEQNKRFYTTASNYDDFVGFAKSAYYTDSCKDYIDVYSCEIEELGEENNEIKGDDKMKVRGFEFISTEQALKDLSDMVNDEAITNETKDNIVNMLLNGELKLPKRATKHSAGYDVFSPFEFTLKPNEVIKIPTLFRAYMQEDEELDIYPRSSFGFKYQMCLVNTVAIGDSDYYNANNEGHYWIKIVNRGDKEMHMKQGEAFAQAIFRKYLLADGDSLDKGEARIGGIGSTSKNK